MKPAAYITTSAQLLDLCAALRDQPWVALDTEFLREKTYWPRLCLIQLATPDIVACIDTLALVDLSPLLEVIYEPQRTVILHAASQDIEILNRLYGTPPPSLFDTQIAAAFLGYGDQIGYASLIQTLLGVQLDKSATRTNWEARPLSQAQLSYAANDVRYLGEAYPRMLAELTRKGRLHWVQEEFARLSDPQTYGIDPEHMWTRIKGHARLQPRQLAALRALAAWREREAIDQDRPRRHILGDTPLLALAQGLPKTRQELKRLRGLAAGQTDRWGALWLEQIKQALELPPEAWPTARIRPATTPETEAATELMMALVHHSARYHSISPSVITTRAMLQGLLSGQTDSPLLQGWRAEIVGDRLSKLVHGQLSIGLDEGRLRVYE